MPITGTLFAVGVDFHAGMTRSTTRGCSSLNIKYILSISHMHKNTSMVQKKLTFYMHKCLDFMLGS